MDQATARRRLISLRKRHGFTQDVVTEALGFSDRQTLSDIELGKRLIAPAELARAARLFDVSIDYFTDPLELAGEACFSWRQTSDDAAGLSDFEARASRWIATWRHLRRLQDASVNSLQIRVGLNEKSSYEEAAGEGEAISSALELGEVPACSLAGVLEERLDTLVLFVDAGPGISGAACQLGALNAILINRNESEGRRAFDLGHELFHVLTWQQFPPAHIDASSLLSPKQKRIEKLADHFSAGLLMPRQSIESFVTRVPVPRSPDELVEWIREGAERMHVSGQAFKWRLVALGYLPKASADRIPDSALRVEAKASDAPARFSRNFIGLVGWGIEQGHLSIRRAADAIGTSVDELAELFSEHGLRTPFDL